MTQYLPPNLLAHFAPRDPIPFLPPPDKLPHQKKTTGYSGVADFLSAFEDPSRTPPPFRIETREERQERRRREKAESVAYKLELAIAKWNPHSNPVATSDAYKTLFVARINYESTEHKVRREFEMYGNIKHICMVHDKNGNARGYAFIEYERERDMHTAYKRADGRKIDNRRVLVDVERGRTVKGWLPRRLGGGLGGTRRGGPDVNVKHSGREEPPKGEERYGERERELPERPERRRSRSRSRERRRRSRSRDRGHRSDRGDRYKRDRSKERERVRDRGEHMLGGDKIEPPDMKMDMPPEPERKERRRSRSRDRERRRRRSRSRERKWYDRDREGRRHDRGEREERVKSFEPTEPIEPVDPMEPLDPLIPQNGFNDQGY